MDRRVPWVIKYRPKRINEVVNQEQAKNKILEWLKKWPNVEKKALLLYGPPGVGKTSLVEAIANELGYELVELNASDNRRKEDIERIVAKATITRSLVSASKRIILLDEIDGIAVKEDAGGLEAVRELIATTTVPIVMTANNPWDQKLRPLRELCDLVQFKKLTKTEMKNLLYKICLNEGIECEEKALEYIIERSEGDLRAAINDLEALGTGKEKVALAEAKILLRPRDKERDPFETLRAMFSANYAWQAKAALNQSQLDYEGLKLWLEENIPYQYQSIDDITRAYEALSRADIYLGRIVRSGDWDLLAYAVDLMTAGVSFAPKTNINDKYRWVKYSFPQRLTLSSRVKEVRSLYDDLVRLLALRLHTSSSTIKNDVIPLLRALFLSNPQLAARIAFGLGLSEKMVELLAGTNKAQIIEYYRQLKRRLEVASKPNGITTVENHKKATKSTKNLLSFSKK